MSERDWIIIAIVVAVLLLALLIYLWIRRRQEDGQYGTMEAVNREEEPEEVDTSGLDECRGRANELAELLGVQKAGGKVRFFDEDQELGDGYMYALMEIPAGERKIWVVFYPNLDYNVIVLVFDRKAPWDVVVGAKEAIDKFFDDDEPEMYGEEDDYLAYVWEDGNYDGDTLRDDVAMAVQIDPDWDQLLKQL